MNNSVDQPLVMGMASRTSSVTINNTQMTATFTFLPEHSMQTNAMTVTLNGTVNAVPLTNAKAFTGKVSLADADGNSVEIGTFSAALDQIMSATDAALFNSDATASEASSMAQKQEIQKPAVEPEKEKAAPAAQDTASSSGAQLLN